MDSHQTTCCIVGGGPGGVMLALLLARAGVQVTLLEAHKDFDRDFRGDTIHPAILEILDSIGLAEPLHKLRHEKIYGPTLRAANTSFTPFDFRRLKIKFPYVMLVPQARFLEFVAAEAAKFPNFRLVMGALVEQLVEEDGAVKGVRYMANDGLHEVRALLTVGAAGRFSKVRRLAGFEPIKTSPPMYILWFHLPHIPGDLPDAAGRLLGGFSRGRILAVFDRFDYWQVGFVFPKGQYASLRAEGLESLRKSIADIEPRFAEHVKTLTDWQQLSLLSVESSMCPQWYKPGLLLIGDAAHVMSPIRGVGINYAIQDAVVAANELAVPLRSGRVEISDLAKVQSQREWPTRMIQRIQSFVQKRLVANVLGTPTAGRIPWALRCPVSNPRPARHPGADTGLRISASPRCRPRPPLNSLSVPCECWRARHRASGKATGRRK